MLYPHLKNWRNITNRSKDIGQAIQYINRAFGVINVVSELNDNDYGKLKKSEFEHRKNRLNKKLSKG